jgi:hypothetical protein
VDNIDRTHWSCKGTCWIRYDFGEPAELEEIRIFWRNSEQRIQSFDLEISLDGRTWSVIFSGESDPIIDPEEIPWPHIYEVGEEVRYVRVTGYGNSFNDWNAIIQIDFIGGPDGAGMPLPYGAIPVEITASRSLGGNTPDRAHDDDFSTFWTGGYGDYIEFELEDVVPLYRVLIAWMNGHLRAQKYAIDISIDGEDWERVHEGTSTGKTQDFEPHIFHDYPLAKYVRIYGYGNNGRRVSSKPKISITEVSIHRVDLDTVLLTGWR